MIIDDKLLHYLEQLAKIRLDDEERAKCGEELQSILSYMDTLNELNTEGVEPLSHSFPVVNVLRSDEVEPSADREAVLQNAPRRKDGCFSVPKTFE